MNEELLRNLYDKYNLSTVGTFDEFKNDMTSPEVRKSFFDKHELSKTGTINEFESDLKGPEVNLQQSALLDVIASKESDGSYDTIVGGGKFTDFSKHPNIIGMETAAGSSTAAGKFQITKETWDEVSAKLGLKDFSPESQEIAAKYLAEQRYNQKTGRSLLEDLNNPDAIDGIKIALSETWPSLKNNDSFKEQYLAKTGLIDAQGSASDPIGPVGVSYAEDVDQSRFDEKILNEIYVKAGGKLGEKYEANVEHDGDTFLGMFKDNRYNISFKDKTGVKSTKYLDREKAGIIDRFDAALVNVGVQTVSGLASFAGAIVGLAEDAVEYNLGGDTNFDKTMDYADNAVNDWLNTNKSKQTTNDSMLAIEERQRQAEESKGAFAGFVQSLSKLGEAQYWEQEGADMLGSQLAFSGLGLASGAIQGTKLGLGLTKVLSKAPLVSEKLAEKIVALGAGSVLNSSAEAVQEAGTAFKEIKQGLLDKGLSEQDATTQAADAASEIFGTNFVMLMATNFIELKGLTDGFSTSKNAIVRGLINTIIQGGSEGVQEAFQTGATEYSKDKALNQPYNEGKNTGVFDSIFGDGDTALGGTLKATYHGLMDGKSAYWDSFTGGFGMAASTAAPVSIQSVHQLYTKEKPIMAKVNSSLALSANDIYKTDEDGKLIYDSNNKPQIDPTKQLSAIRGMNDALQIDQLQEEALRENNGEAIKVLQAAKISNIVHDHLAKGDNLDAIENAINNSMTKKDYEKNKLSEFYSYEEFKDIKKNVLDIAKDNYQKIYSDPVLKTQSAQFKQAIYHNSVQQDLVGKELDKYTNQLEELNSKGDKLNSLEKEKKKGLETKVASLTKYKSELEKSFEKFISNKSKDSKDTKAEEIKTKTAEAIKQGVSPEEILANKTGEELKAAKEGLIEANTQAIIDELDTYNSPKQYEAAIKNNPEHAKLINDHFNNKLAKQTKAPLTNVNQILTRYGQENNFLQEHEQQKVGQELNNLLNEKENLGEEVANYEQLRTDPNFKFIPDPELVHLGQHILNGGSVATYTQTFNQDNLQDPLLQKAIDRTNNIKEVPVKKESSLPEVINEKETKETEAPFTAPEVFVPMSGLPESRGKNKTVYVTIFDSNGNEVETKVSRFVPKDIWNTSQSSKLEKLNEYFNLSEGHSYKETVIPENEEFNKGTHVASTILREGDTIYYEVTPNDWNNTATKDNFIISVVSYIKNGKVVKKNIIDAERIVVSQVPSNTNSFIKDNVHKLEIKKIRELAWEKFNNNRSSTFQIAEVKVKNLNRTTAYHKGSWRNITKKEIKNFIFDVVIQKWENNEVGFSSSVEDPALFNSGNSLVGTGNMTIEPQDIGKVIMFIPNTNSITGEISNVPVKLNTKKLSEVPIFKQKFIDALNDIMKLSTFDERLEATNKMWYNLIGSKVGSISRKRTEDSTFDTDSKDGLVNPRGGIGNIIYYQESKFDPTKKGFFTVINGEEFSYLSVEDLVNKLGETRVHIPHDLVKLTLERFPELVQTDLIEPQERGIESEMPNIFMGTNVMVESLPERIDIIEQEQEQLKQEQEKEQENGIIEEDENIIPVFKISNKSYTGTGAKEYIKERFTEIGVDISDASLDILRELYEVGDKKIWGAFHKAVVHLASDAGLKVGKHEAMHVLFNLFLNPKQKEQIYKELFKNFGKELGISKEEFEKELNKPINQINKFKVEDNNQVNYILKVIDILQSDKAKQIFVKGRKNLWSLDKILTELNIPKEQKELVKQIEQDFVQKQFAIYDESLQYALELADKYSYTVEINTAKARKDAAVSNFNDEGFRGNDGFYYTSQYEENGYSYFKYDVGGNQFNITEKDFNLAKNESELVKNSDYYSNLTVPGGTNYTENEISTPLITPSIKGHAQFATDNGIGWFRSDEQSDINDVKNKIEAEKEFKRIAEQEGYADTTLLNQINKQSKGSKTRRILEVQSDLFQKGRDKDSLIYKTDSKKLADEIAIDISKTTGLQFVDETIKQNQFLQLLNKDNNWVTFFVKSIIQDTAKQTVTEVQESDVEAKVRELEKDGLLEIDCKGKLKAEKGLQTNFTKGGKWKIFEIFEGKSHKQGGIDINIKNNQINFTNKNGSIKAKYGLVISKDS